MSRGDDSRHDTSRQVSREAMAAKAASMAPNVFRPATPRTFSAADNVLPSEARQMEITGGEPGEFGSIVRAGNRVSSGTSIRGELSELEGLPEHSAFYDQFPVPKRAVRSMESQIGLERLIGGLMSDEIGDEAPATKLVDVGMRMPVSPVAEVKGDTVERFDPSIIEDPTLRQAAIRKNRTKKAAEGRRAAASAEGAISAETDRAIRQVWGVPASKKYKPQMSTAQRKAALEAKEAKKKKKK